MFDFDPSLTADPAGLLGAADASSPGLGFTLFKRVFDILGALLLLAAMLQVATALLVANPFYNRGPLYFVQTRMGRDCQPFRTFKFRSMLPGDHAVRGAFDALETNRINRLGNVLRKTRLDELPQAINVLRGEMSLIGPRPDYFDHACAYIEQVPGYRARLAARPGITGLAQTEIGYAEGIEMVSKKVAADLAYISNRSIRLDLWITARTIKVMLLRQGT